MSQTILEARLIPIAGSHPTAYQVAPEWTDTGYDDLRDLLDAAQDGIGDRPELFEGSLEVYGASGAMIYAWSVDGEPQFVAYQLPA